MNQDAKFLRDLKIRPDDDICQDDQEELDPQTTGVLISLAQWRQMQDSICTMAKDLEFSQRVSREMVTHGIGLADRALLYRRDLRIACGICACLLIAAVWGWMR